MVFNAATKVNIKAIENGFPIGSISQLAERESWRKEIYRPIYYIHKWWARRLGSVFRAIVLAGCVDVTDDVEKLFYDSAQFPDVTVFDPFMGSGTTIGEAVKLGCRSIGRDINPVAANLVKTALQPYSRDEVNRIYRELQDNVSNEIRAYYKTILPNGEEAEVLYYFWVKIIDCPNCETEIRLFKKRIFSQHATPKKYPKAKSTCPCCEDINDTYYNSTETTCECGCSYNPQEGPVSGAYTTCPSCSARFKTINAVRRLDKPLQHRLYAKMVLTRNGKKQYLLITENDKTLYQTAESELANHTDLIPIVKLTPGYNTNQVLNYNYTFWHQMFNSRQLLGITWLVSEIKKLNEPYKTLFATLLSGTLEFNNMFCSFKGEGTGAVRHMFSHHILKPEFTPIEANLWGTPKSSGAFSTLYSSRIMRALDYKDKPFELKLKETSSGKWASEKIFTLSPKVNRQIADTYSEFIENDAVYISCGDSSETDIPSGSVDLVVTDPPFFDNVHYSQLADFFYVWLRQMLGETGFFSSETTRSKNEVQDTDSHEFSNKLEAVFSECHRVLKDSGLLIFTYHHSRVEGWTSVYKAIRAAGFQITYTHPVKSEMAVSIPIQKSNTPVHFDLIIVCRKWEIDEKHLENAAVPLLTCLEEAGSVVNELKKASIDVSLGDIKVILMGTILSKLHIVDDLHDALETLIKLESQADVFAHEIISSLDEESNPTPHALDRASPEGTLRDLPLFALVQAASEANTPGK